MGYKQMFIYFDKAEYISNGANTDPQLKYNGKLYNYYAIEDAMFDMYLEDRDLTHFDEYDDSDFENWCKDNQNSIEDLFN